MKKHLDNFNQQLKQAGVTNLVRFLQFPIFDENPDKRQLIRLENLSEDTPATVQLQDIVDYMMLMVTGPDGHVSADVDEQLNRITVTEVRHAGLAPVGTEFKGKVLLNPMSMRSFLVTFSETAQKHHPGALIDVEQLGFRAVTMQNVKDVLNSNQMPKQEFDKYAF